MPEIVKKQCDADDRSLQQKSMKIKLFPMCLIEDKQNFKPQNEDILCY